MPQFINPDDIRTMFSRAMSQMYKREVPQYGLLMDLVADVNAKVLEENPALKRRLEDDGEIQRLDVERHGAIRLGTEYELKTIARLFAVMGMYPVGYYDLAAAGTPVHSTAFRPVTDESLRRNPFRIFTSLLRLDLIADVELRQEASQILARRSIFTSRALALIEVAERNGGLAHAEAEEFVLEALEAFRWHSTASVDHKTYANLSRAHRLVADIVCFRGPHINHLTPRTLDIDEVQRRMPLEGIASKEFIEGPPRRRCDILLRQTSFKALDEPIVFETTNGASTQVTHMARFGEIEQRGIALTSGGRRLYDELLSNVQKSDPASHGERLAQAFSAFPDDWETLRVRKLAYFRYEANTSGLRKAAPSESAVSIASLIEDGSLVARPIIYEDFLPVSAAGIFRSNLGAQTTQTYRAAPGQQLFEAALGLPVHDEFALYAAAEAASLDKALTVLGIDAAQVRG